MGHLPHYQFLKKRAALSFLSLLDVHVRFLKNNYYLLYHYISIRKVWLSG